MGFGYLLIGYFITFVLKITADALQVGALALLIGYGTMLLGLWRLRQFCKAFSWAGWILCPLCLLAVYRLIETVAEAFLLTVPFVNPTVGTVVTWAEFLLIMVFHAALLSAVREIGMQVELKNISSAAIRNMIIVLVYGIVYVFTQPEFPLLQSVQKYFVLSRILLGIVMIVCNLALLLSCTKNICREGDETIERKRYRLEFLNRLGDAFERNFQKASERSRSDMEAYLKKKQDKRMSRAEKQDRRKRSRRKKK